jgi:putative membrane protein
MTDLLYAVGHHLLIFALFAVLVAEKVRLTRPVEAADLRRLAALDAAYGAMAMAILVLGFCRAIFAAKGWSYYSHNLFFWVKIGTFAVIGLLSIPVTMKILGWRKRARKGDAAIEATEIARVRRFVTLELALFPILLAAAAAMARGFGEFAW